MTQQFDDRNRGSIWPNKKKREGKSDPDFTGSLNVDGHDYWVSAWKRKEGSSANSPSLSFSVKQKDGKRAPAAPEQAGARPSPQDDMDDIIPF